jgi:hypothetical protein
MAEIAETELIAALRTGSVIDGEASDGPRSVPAALLRQCCHQLRDQVDPRGMRLSNLVVTGCLDLAGLTVPFPLRFDNCEFDTAPVVEGARLYELAMTGCPRLPGLFGNGLSVRRDLDLSRSRVAGALWTSASTSRSAAIWLCEADIGGRLLCAGTVLDGQGYRALQADRIHVGGTVRLIQGFRSAGEVRFLGARIDGSLDFAAAQIESVDGPALDLEGAVIGGSVFMIDDLAGRKPEILGRLTMASARLAGRFIIRNAIIQVGAVGQTGSIYERPTSASTALDAPRLSVGAEMVLTGRCEVTGRIDMSMSEVSSVSIGAQCVLRAPDGIALDLTNARIRALLRLDEWAAVEGTIRMPGAVIRGRLALHGELSRPRDESVIDGSAMTVDGDVYLDRLRTDGGAVTLAGARLGSLSARNAQLHNPGGYSLRLSQAQVNGPVRLISGFSSTGLVAFNRTTVEGRLHFTDGSFRCPQPSAGNEAGHAIEAISATVRGSIDLGWAAVSPSVDFTDVTTTSLADNPATWPERFVIAGMTYERFERPQGGKPGRIWDQAARCAWLRRQTEFDSGPYEQAARVFQQHGYTREAEHILIAQRQHARQVGRSHTAWPRRVLDMIYATIGYGYRPARVLWLLALLLALVTISLEVPSYQAALRANNGNGDVYTTSGLLTASSHGAPGAAATGGTPRDTCGDGEVRCFSPVLYAIDTVIPLISLDQRATWYADPDVPNGQFMLWWLNLATLLGWVLSSIFVLSLARLSRSSLCLGPSSVSTS